MTGKLTMKLTLEQLESHLWKAADILRGSTDASEYKRFVLPLLFLKRLSDRFDEGGLEKTREGAERSYDRFVVPPEARWETIAASPNGLGTAVQAAFRRIEEENPDLEALFAPFTFDDPFRLPPAALRRLVEHFSKISLRDRDLDQPDLLGRGYEYLLKQFTEAEKGRGGEFYTPREVVRLMVEVLDPHEGQTICDPTCGTGGMLLECALHVQKAGGNPQRLTLHGHEKNPTVWSMCRMNMLLHGLTARIELADTIREPKLVAEDRLILYDLVIANPPFSVKDWGREEAASDPFGRFRYGLPGQFGDLAFVQHMVASLNDTGRMAVVVPNGVLFRGNDEAKIRRGLVDDDLVEAVISLPDKLFYNTGIPAAILVLNKAKTGERRGRTLFVDASQGYREGRSQNFLRDRDIDRAVEACRRFGEVPHYAHVATLEEVQRNDYNLTVSRYVAPSMTEEDSEPEEIQAELQRLETERDALRGKLESLFMAMKQCQEVQDPSQVETPQQAKRKRVDNSQLTLSKGGSP